MVDPTAITTATIFKYNIYVSKTRLDNVFSFYFNHNILLDHHIKIPKRTNQQVGLSIFHCYNFNSKCTSSTPNNTNSNFIRHLDLVYNDSCHFIQLHIFHIIFQTYLWRRSDNNRRSSNTFG